MSTPSVQVTIKALGKEVFTATEVPSAQDVNGRTLTNGGIGLSSNLDPTTTPKVDKSPIVLNLTLGAGITTIDLTAVAGLSVPPGVRTLDMTGAKLTGLIARAKSTNTNTVNIAPGAANAYTPFGAGNDIDLRRGEVVGKFYDGVASGHAAVSATVKNIDVSSGFAGDVVQIELYFGT